MTTMTTNCPLDCPDLCALKVDLDGGRVTALDGDPDNPHTRGFICGKVRRFTRHLYGKDRIETPLLRTGPKGSGQFRPISWDEAIEQISNRLASTRDAYGGEAILPYHYGGSNGFLSDGLLDQRFFARLGASRLEKTICAAPSGTAAMALYGMMPGVAFEDFVHARCIVIWGANPKATHIHLVPFLDEAVKRGAFVIAIDPMRHFSENKIGLHLPVKPGTDLPLALAMIRYWKEQGDLDDVFVDQHVHGAEALLRASQPWTLARAAETCWLSETDIEHCARRIADADPALIRLGWGQERNTNGGHASAAILAIPALLGKFGVRGGGYAFTASPATRYDPETVLGPLDWHTRTINMTPLAQHLTSGDLDPPIRALFVYNSNPVATCPDQNLLIRGLENEELFTVVHDAFMTDSCNWADIVLPATTFLEHFDIRRGYGNYAVGGIVPLVAPLGKARSNHDLFASLGQAMGFEDPAFSWTQGEAFDRVAESLSLNGEKADLALLREGRQQRVTFSGMTPIQFVDVQPRTDDQKIHLDAEALGEEPYCFQEVADIDHPLTLITPASAKLITSTFGDLVETRVRVTVHPEEARLRGLNPGNVVQVYNALGDIRAELQTDPRLARGVAMIPKGIWRRHSATGTTAAALCPSHVEPVGKGACFNDARVQISAAAS